MFFFFPNWLIFDRHEKSFFFPFCYNKHSSNNILVYVLFILEYIFIFLILFSFAELTNLIKQHLKCQQFHWFPLGRLKPLGRRTCAASSELCGSEHLKHQECRTHSSAFTHDCGFLEQAGFLYLSGATQRWVPNKEERQTGALLLTFLLLHSRMKRFSYIYKGKEWTAEHFPVGRCREPSSRTS